MSPSRFLSELKRRRVVRVAAVYAAVAFVVLQTADILLPGLGVPAWALSLVIVLLILGLPVALVVAWALELTPEGVKATAPAPTGKGESEALPPLLGRRTALLAMALVALGIGLGAGWILKPEGAGGSGTGSTPGTGVAPEGAASPTGGAVPAGGAAFSLEDTPEEAGKSIAVLPFDDLSPGGDQEWFSDGLTEEILNGLARLDELRVTARNSSFQFKNRAVDVRDVGRQLGVANVLEGSVRRVGDQLRITAQLIRVEDGFHLWSESYDRHLDDVFAVQLDIAENIARVLDVYLDDERRARMIASGTRDPAAFLHYLRGRALYNDAHEMGVGESDVLWQANAWFERALETDPGYALARFYHADALSHALMMDLPVPPGLALPGGAPDLVRIQSLMHQDLDRAVEDAGDGPLAPSLALVRYYLRGDWDRLPRAIARLDEERAARAMEIVSGGWFWYPMMIAGATGKTRELAQWRLRRDPLDVTSWADMIELELRAGRVEEARRLYDQASDQALPHRYLQESLVRILLASGRADEVLSVHSGRSELEAIRWWVEALAHAELGDAEQARAALQRAPGGYLNERQCWILARIGDQDGANECARQIDAAPQGWVRLTRVIVDHGSIPFDPEAAPRFTAMYASLGGNAWPRTTPGSRSVESTAVRP